jgi:hypothetical protein
MFGKKSLRVIIEILILIASYFELVFCFSDDKMLNDKKHKEKKLSN